MAGNYKNIVLSCIEPRPLFQETFQNFVNRLGGGYRPNLAGSSLQFTDPESEKFALRQLDLPIKVGGADTLILLEHEDCLAYRQAGLAFSSPKEEIRVHQEQFEKAKQTIKDKIPALYVIGKMAMRDGSIIDL